MRLFSARVASSPACPGAGTAHPRGAAARLGTCCGFEKQTSRLQLLLAWPSWQCFLCRFFEQAVLVLRVRHLRRSVHRSSSAWPRPRERIKAL